MFIEILSNGFVSAVAVTGFVLACAVAVVGVMGKRNG